MISEQIKGNMSTRTTCNTRCCSFSRSHLYCITVNRIITLSRVFGWILICSWAVLLAEIWQPWLVVLVAVTDVYKKLTNNWLSPPVRAAKAEFLKSVMSLGIQESPDNAVKKYKYCTSSENSTFQGHGFVLTASVRLYFIWLTQLHNDHNLQLCNDCENRFSFL